MNIDSNEPLPLRIKIATGLFVLFIALIFIPAKWFGFGNTSYEQSLPESSTFTVKTLISDTNADPDGDGIPNWQESLLGTDPRSATTNGVPDTSKVDTNTSVFISPPNSSTTSFSVEDQKNLAQINDPNNITGQIAKNQVGIASYLSKDETVDSDAAVTVGENIYAEASKLAEAKVYTENDITFAKTETFASIKTYGNMLATLYLDDMKKVALPDDLVTLSAYLNDKDPKKLALFSTKLAVVTKARETLLSMAVPRSAAASHLAAINATEGYRNLLYSFSQVNEDPMRALIATKGSIDVFAKMIALPKDFALYFDSKNVVFTPKESGYLFMQAILQP